MTDYRSIDLYIRRAHLERSQLIGELIAHGIFTAWVGAKKLARRTSARFAMLVDSPDRFSVALPLHSESPGHA